MNDLSLLRRLATHVLSTLALALAISPLGAASLSLDRDFRPPLFVQPATPVRALLLPDGKFLIFFSFDTLSDQRTGAIARFLPGGELDSTFNFSRTDYKFVSAALPVANGQLIIAATRRLYDRQDEQRILRLNSDGSIDPTFNIADVNSEANTVRAFALQADGKILVGGFFDTFAGQPKQKIVRLLPNGALDDAFNPPQFTNRGIWTAPVVLGDGKNPDRRRFHQRERRSQSWSGAPEFRWLA